jgi:hypothetical protein
MTMPGFDIDEALRSESSRSPKDARGSWDDNSPAEFIPERWLKTEGDAEVFDSHAGPFLSFSQGIRGLLWHTTCLLTSEDPDRVIDMEL